MSKKRRLIPFRWLPWVWHLNQRDYQEAEARYYHDGDALTRALIDIQYDDHAERRRRHLALDLREGKLDLYGHDLELLKVEGRAEDVLALLDLELKHNRIDAYERERRLIEHLHKEGQDRDLALLDLDRQYGKIEGKGYDKMAATIRQEPWIGIVNDGFDLTQGLNGVYFEFDWNEFWIDYLKIAGYYGRTDEDIVEMWFNDVCRSMALQTEIEDFEEGDFAPDSPLVQLTQRQLRNPPPR